MTVVCNGAGAGGWGGDSSKLEILPQSRLFEVEDGQRLHRIEVLSQLYGRTRTHTEVLVVMDRKGIEKVGEIHLRAPRQRLSLDKLSKWMTRRGVRSGTDQVLYIHLALCAPLGCATVRGPVEVLCGQMEGGEIVQMQRYALRLPLDKLSRRMMQRYALRLSLDRLSSWMRREGGKTVQIQLHALRRLFFFVLFVWLEELWSEAWVKGILDRSVLECQIRLPQPRVIPVYLRPREIAQEAARGQHASGIDEDCRDIGLIVLGTRYCTSASESHAAETSPSTGRSLRIEASATLKTVLPPCGNQMLGPTHYRPRESGLSGYEMERLGGPGYEFSFVDTDALASMFEPPPSLFTTGRISADGKQQQERSVNETNLRYLHRV
ncbi:hypothetical protein BDQ17DRAFT_1333605 [Cyathus striatus]|nr:hypothetical protein BDQ17DRAFT_1333605 [Cyathus striatus]